MDCSNKGFTLIELMMTLAVLSVLLVLGVPTFHSIIQNNRAVAMSSEFIASLHVARSEAVKRSVPVSMCSAADSDLDACGGSGNWTNGWIVFVDPNSDGVIAAATDRVQVQNAPPTGSQIGTTASVVTFDGTGIVTAGSGTFSLSATNCEGNHGRLITVTNAGRLAVEAQSC